MSSSHPSSFLSFNSFPLPLFPVFPPKLFQVKWVEKTEMGVRQAEKKAGAATRGSRERMGGMVVWQCGETQQFGDSGRGQENTLESAAWQGRKEQKAFSSVPFAGLFAGLKLAPSCGAKPRKMPRKNAPEIFFSTRSPAKSKLGLPYS